MSGDVNDELEANSSDAASSVDCWGCRMPREILMKIFQTGVQMDGPVPLLCRTARVCSVWREVSYSQCLWEAVDLSTGWIRRDRTGFNCLCETRLRNTRSLSLSAWFQLDHSNIERLVECCGPRLHRLSLSHCSSVGDDGLRLLADKCPQLQQLDLSCLHATACSNATMVYLIKRMGCHLKRLNLSGNVINTSIIDQIATYCCGLEELELNSVEMFRAWPVYVDPEHMQRGFPRLRVLQMKDSPFQAKATFTTTHLALLRVLEVGFAQLETFSAPRDMGSDFLNRVLRCSKRLRQLDLQQAAVHGDLSGVPAQALETVTLPQREPSSPLLVQLKRWCHSLVELDLSWCVEDRSSLEAGMQRTFGPPDGTSFPNLQRVTLCGTKVSFHGLRPLLQSCPRLSYVNLLLCPLMPFGWGREYEGSSLLQLKNYKV